MQAHYTQNTFSIHPFGRFRFGLVSLERPLIRRWTNGRGDAGTGAYLRCVYITQLLYWMICRRPHSLGRAQGSGGHFGSSNPNYQRISCFNHWQCFVSYFGSVSPRRQYKLLNNYIQLSGISFGHNFRQLCFLIHYAMMTIRLAAMPCTLFCNQACPSVDPSQIVWIRF